MAAIVKDEPSITLPVVRVIAATNAACAVAAGAWAGVSAALGYDGGVVVGGVIGAGLTAGIASVVFLLTMPWMPKPASTTMLLWMVSDFMAMGLTLGAAYLLYSATLVSGALAPPLLGVVLAFFLVLLAKVAVAASHMKTLGLM